MHKALDSILCMAKTEKEKKMYPDGERCRREGGILC
jgi:hypothetical protein